MHKRRLIWLTLVIWVVAAWQVANAAGVLTIGWSTFDGGGGALTGGNFALNGTVGQTDTTQLAGGSFDLNGGFWHPDSSTPTAITLTEQPTTIQPYHLLVITAVLLTILTAYYINKEQTA